MTKQPQPTPIGWCPTCGRFLFSLESSPGFAACEDGHKHYVTREMEWHWEQSRRNRPVSPAPPKGNRQ